MRILHTSDWHLGRVLHEHSLLRDQESFLGSLLEHLRECPYEALVVAGDVFDRSIPSEEAVGLWNGFLEGFRAACPETALLVIAGNHDSAARVALASRLLEAGGIHIRGGGERVDEPVRLPGADVWLVPFLWSGSLAVGGENGRVMIQTQREALAEAVARIRLRMDPQRINILVAHCFAVGGEVSDSERTLVGTAVQVETQLFEGFDYVALGHLHRPQGLGPRIRYSGTPLAYSFSEAGQAKSMAAITLTKGVDPELELVPVRPFRTMLNLKGSLEELMEDERFAGLGEAYVRVTLTGPAGITQPVARLRSRFPLLLDFQEYVAPQSQALAPLPALRKPDIGEEFQAFERRLRDGDPPGPLVAAFSELRAELERTR
ncbi:exonuclease SbcCD subunit D [Holophaga foetida]|uniref:exonuclease SbcCD subunit D n=1 Tax=Holophaga foetida TaxID=35839 RepID=UPI000247213F|nr:exonuclease SbcCD subunit D [Holophaga foetida]